MAPEIKYWLWESSYLLVKFVPVQKDVLLARCWLLLKRYRICVVTDCSRWIDLLISFPMDVILAAVLLPKVLAVTTLEFTLLFPTSIYDFWSVVCEVSSFIINCDTPRL